MIYLHTLGDTLIKVGDKEIRPTAPLVFACLLYLCTERGRRVPRAALQEMLFPNVDERSGAHSLRQLLYKLRQLGVPLDADSSTVVVHSKDVVDATAFDVSDIASWDGGFLPHYSPQISPRYSEWLEGRRAVVLADLRKRLSRGIASYREALNWSAVEQYAKVLLAIDPLNEVATLAMAEAAALTGGKAAALRLLEDYERETGHSDIRVPAAILRRRISLSVSEPVSRPVAMPFTGRETEIAALRTKLIEVRSGQPMICVLVGEAGIGKSRLLEEVSSLAALEGINVHTVRCQSHYSSRPLSVFISLVPELLQAPGALGISPQSLHCLNLLTCHTGGLPEQSTDVRDAWTRSEQLLFALRDLVYAVASERPLMLCVEDAHWADNDSLRQLRHLIHECGDLSLAVVCTSRTPQSVCGQGQAVDREFIQRLRPLGKSTMRSLAVQLLGGRDNTSSPQDYVEWCVSVAGGNPLFLQSLCQRCEGTQQPFLVPPDITSALTARVNKLSAVARRILVFSSLLGHHSTLDLLRTLTECSAIDMLEAIQQLEDEGCICLEGRVLRVAHHLLGETALGQLGAASRAALHACVAATLEEEYERTKDASVLWDCAEHCALSGADEKAVHFLRRCAGHAARLGRASHALSILERALQLTTVPSVKAVVLEDMMLAAKAAGKWDDVEKFSTQHRRYQQRTNLHSVAELVSIDAAWMQRLDAQGSLGRAMQCVRSNQASDSHRIHAALIAHKMAHEIGNSELAFEAFSAVEPWLDPASIDYPTRILPLLYHGCFGDRVRSIAIAKQLVIDLPRFSDISDELRAASNGLMVLAWHDVTDAALNAALSYYDKAVAEKMTYWQYDFAALACWVYLTKEDFESASEWHREAEKLLAQSSALHWRRRLSSNALELAIWSGRGDVAAEWLAVATATGFGDSIRSKAYFRGAEIRVAQFDPDYQCPDSVIAELRELFSHSKRLTGADGLATALAEALARRGFVEELRQTVNEYCHSSRRELTPLPPSVKKFLERDHQEDQIVMPV